MSHLTFSTLTAISELFVTAGVLFLVISNLRQQKFPLRLGVGLLVFEFSVNMLYMIYRMQHPSHLVLPDWLKITAALHGSLSLLVFILLAVLIFLAHAEFRRGNFFFRKHPAVTSVFIALWMASVTSGELMYYFIHHTDVTRIASPTPESPPNPQGE